MDASLEKTAFALQERLEAAEPLAEELFRMLFDRFAGQIADGEKAGQSVSEERACAWVQTQFAIGAYESASSEQSFGLGAFWGAIGVRDACLRAISENHRDIERKQAVDRHRKLFQAVLHHPGITHAQLAESYGKSVSRLTQIIAEFDGLSLLVVSRSGRTKHYYLSSRAVREIEGGFGLSNSVYPTNARLFDYGSSSAGASSVPLVDNAARGLGVNGVNLAIDVDPINFASVGGRKQPFNNVNDI